MASQPFVPLLAARLDELRRRCGVADEVLEVAQGDTVYPAAFWQAVIECVRHFDLARRVGAVAQQDNAIVAPDGLGTGVVQAGSAAITHDEEGADSVASKVLVEEGVVEAAPDPFGKLRSLSCGATQSRYCGS